MNRIGRRQFVVLGLVFGLLVSTAYTQQRGKKEYTFRGKVQKVDAKAKKLVVDGEKVEGWMEAMTMTYTVDKADVLNTLKAGDQITAKVYEGDFQMLHDVKVVRPDGASSPKK